MKKIVYIFGFITLFISGASLSAQSNYKIVNKMHLEGEGGWDYISTDAVNGRIYVSHATVAQVVDSKTGKLLGTIPDTKGIHGIAFATGLNKGFTSNGRDSSVTVFDLKTLQVITKVKVTGKNPDAILYDPFSKKVFTFNGGSANATVIDAITNKVVATIPLDGKPEFSATDGKGTIFVNIEDKSSINVINSSTLKVTRHWSIAPGEEPSGLALDNKNHRLFSVCSNKMMVVADAETGKVITTLPIGDRCDGVAFDSGKKRAYSSNGEGTITVVQEVDANTFKVVETVPTLPGARTITVDELTHHLYLPTAEFGPASANSRRPAVKPNSFMILDVETLK
ncbi:MAG: YncE family protein [Bacteroidota bacterium]|nr:YncE family protein [Bacteroidota bacterium]